jgi:hypothetical protein
VNFVLLLGDIPEEKVDDAHGWLECGVPCDVPVLWTPNTAQTAGDDEEARTDEASFRRILSLPNVRLLTRSEYDLGILKIGGVPLTAPDTIFGWDTGLGQGESDVRRLYRTDASWLSDIESRYPEDGRIYLAVTASEIGKFTSLSEELREAFQGIEKKLRKRASDPTECSARELARGVQTSLRRYAGLHVDAVNVSLPMISRDISIFSGRSAIPAQHDLVESHAQGLRTFAVHDALFRKPEDSSAPYLRANVFRWCTTVKVIAQLRRQLHVAFAIEAFPLIGVTTHNTTKVGLLVEGDDAWADKVRQLLWRKLHGISGCDPADIDVIPVSSLEQAQEVVPVLSTDAVEVIAAALSDDDRTHAANDSVPMMELAVVDD